MTRAHGSDPSYDLIDAELSAGSRDGGALLTDVALQALLGSPCPKSDTVRRAIEIFAEGRFHSLQQY